MARFGHQGSGSATAGSIQILLLVWNLNWWIQVWELLKDHYVESSDGKYRICYSKEFLEWDMASATADWLLGLVQADELMGFIAATPINLSVAHEPEVPCAEINFFCLHPKLRQAIATCLHCGLTW